ncbi:hypothetical protein BaRGS_00006557, partial [Batillaria attramentaria]
MMNDNGKQVQIIMHYSTDEIFYIAANPSPKYAAPLCTTSNLTTDDNTQLFGMRGDSNSGVPHLFSTANILNFINGSEVYKGRTAVDSIPVNRWTACLYWPQLNSNFTLDYYFTVALGSTYYPNGTVSNFNHMYQYVNFEEYVNDPEGKFETPPGVYCLMRQKEKSVPQLGNHFYYREEITDTGSDNGGLAILSEADIWYDFDLQLVRFDQRSSPTGISRDFSNSLGPFSTIHDYGTGVQYTIDRYYSRCSIDPIPYSARGFDAVNNITRQTLGMRGPMGFFNLNDSTYLYAGKRMARGVNCDVFQAVLTNLPGRGLVVYEVYFMSGANDITDRGANADSVAPVPIRIMEWEDGSLVNEYNIHDFDQDSPTYDKFDISVCFPGQNSKDLELFMHMTPRGSGSRQLMPTMFPYLDGLMHMSMAISIPVSPIRFQHTRMHWDNNNVYYQATLLGAAPSLAKYEITSSKTMSQNAGKAIPNIASKWICAQQCDYLQEWNCVEFDYCQSTQVCTLGKASTVSPASSLLDNSQCNHYTRVLGGGFDSQTPLNTSWEQLKNLVYSGQLTFTLPLPDSTGNVDLNVDTTTLDPSQKMTFTAYFITDQVISGSQISRSGSSVAIAQFSRVPRRSGKGYDTLIRGVSVDDCAADCVGEVTYACQSFHYCWEAGACFLSRRHPDEQPDLLKFDANCDLYFRNYSANYQQFSGQTVLSNSDTIYQNVISPNQCAKLCTYYTSFHCESFDFCTDLNTCYLGRTHYYDAPKANIQQTPTCSHYSRNFLADFVAKSHKVVALRDNRVIQDVSPAQCAKLCVEETTFRCNSFDYCGNYSECRLSDASVANTGQVTLQSSAYCDVYQRQFGSASAAVASSQSSSSGNKYDS